MDGDTMKTEAEIADELFDKELDCCLKIGSIKVVDQRKAARGQVCMVQLPCCNHDSDTTVLHHIRGTGLGGVGRKPPDFFGVNVCSDCHMAIHRQAHTDLEHDFVRLYELEGWMRQKANEWEGKL